MRQWKLEESQLITVTNVKDHDPSLYATKRLGLLEHIPLSVQNMDFPN
jgi:hypothetical protein